MTDFTTMSEQELLRGLMRGNRSELKLGYSPANAVLAVQDMRPDADRDELQGYSEGFQDGMQRSDRMWTDTDKDTPEHRAYDAGYAAGFEEPVEITYPSTQPV